MTKPDKNISDKKLTKTDQKKASIYAIRRQMSTMVMSIGLILGSTLILLQAYLIQSEGQLQQSDAVLNTAVQVLQPFTDVICQVIVQIFSQGFL